jgi:hypothetical protein
MSHGSDAVLECKNPRMGVESGSDARWTTVQAENAGQPLIVRIRTDLAKQELQGHWPNRMVVLWRCFRRKGLKAPTACPAPLSRRRWTSSRMPSKRPSLRPAWRS